MIYFDPMKLERPHRSGVIAVILGYALVWAMAFLSTDFSGQEGSLLSTLACEVAPFLCIQPKEQAKTEQPKEYSVTKLIYCPKCSVRKKSDVCMVHVMAKKDGTVLQDQDFKIIDNYFCDYNAGETQYWTSGIYSQEWTYHWAKAEQGGAGR